LTVLVVGCGNTLRGDDGIGIHLVEELAHLPMPEGTTTHICQQYTPELAADLALYDRVLFVDAATPYGAKNYFPGRVALQDVAEMPTQESHGLSHSVDAASLVNLTRVLYGTAPKASILTIEGVDFDLGESLSPLVQAAIPEMISLAKSFCCADH
jgi:hydrogenase maturation protease